MCLFDWMLTQKASGNYSPSKDMCRDVSSTVNHTALSQWFVMKVCGTELPYLGEIMIGRVSPWPTSKHSLKFLLQ
jgi:hypothetical protein